MVYRPSRVHAPATRQTEARKLLGAGYDVGLMKATLATPPTVASPDPRTRAAPLALLFFSLALIWFEAIRHLRSEWSFNPQYS